MKLATSCCCGCTLRTGCLIIGWYLLVIFSISLSYGLYNLSVVLANKDILQQQNTFGTVITSVVINLVTNVGHIIVNSFLLAAVYKQKSAYFIPYIITEIILLVIGVLSWILIMIGSVTVGLYALPFYLLSICLGLYFLWIVRSYQIQVREEENQATTDHTNKDLV